MPYLQFNNAAEELSFLAGSLDPYRNVREVSYCRVAPGFMRVKGLLRDDSNIPADRPRLRVNPLEFDVVVPERVSVEDLRVVIWEQTKHLAYGVPRPFSNRASSLPRQLFQPSFNITLLEPDRPANPYSR
jgi:hypothetical protein